MLAALSCIAVGAWQFTTVQINFEGKITGLFCIGRDFRIPERAQQTIPIFRQTAPFGYDWTLYWLIALDPVFEHGTVPYLDDLRVRYRRILVPALAYSFALGNASWTPFAYVSVVLGFVFLGVFATARLFVANGLSTLHGLWFLLLPATLTSVDRMTVDVALAALLAVWLLRPGVLWLRCIVLMAAALTRETGLLLIAQSLCGRSGAGIQKMLWLRCWRRFRQRAGMSLWRVTRRHRQRCG